ncbi:MAG: recombinase [Flavobacteriales bacterium]|nr:recombinase [Flavobacteriales bacterium]
MNLRRTPKKTQSLHELFENHASLPTQDASNELFFLVDLIHFFRPKQPKKIAIVSLSNLITFLRENPFYKEFFKAKISSIIQERKFSRLLSDAGILQNTDFFYEVKKRVFAKVLPFQPEKDTLEFVLNQIFYKSSDAIWIAKIPMEELKELFSMLHFSSIYESAKEKSPLSELMNTMGLLSQRMSGRAMDSEVLMMTPEYENLESPFVALEKELLHIIDQIRKGSVHFISPDDEHYKQLLILHKQSNEYVDRAFGNSSKFGISLQVNQSLLRIRQQLHRLKILFPLLTVSQTSDKLNNSLQLVVLLIKFNCRKNNIRQLISESTQLLSYEITQHTAKTGEHYITETSSEYYSMLKASIGGGIIVGFLCIFKLLLSKVDTSDFGHALLYSLNYSLGFIAIYLLGFTLATKQPAMTASALILAIEVGMKKITKSQKKHQSFAELFARLFRSQFIAFVGNVLIAFPVALLIIWLIDKGFGANIASQKAGKLITDLNPIQSASIFHAAIAGVFLFLSGIISGNVSNKSKHSQLYYRIQEHPLLKMSLGKKKTIQIAQWFERNWAGVVSNGWFGVFLGSTASIGIFLGLNLDIRHITFASGNFALGLYGTNFVMDEWTIFWSILGIGIIGFVNFIVSFSLSLGLAFRSRDIPISEVKLLIQSIWAYFKSKPMAFLFPVKSN